MIKRLTPLPQSNDLLRQIGSVVRNRIYPPPIDLRIEQIEVDEHGALILIDIPPQPEEMAPFLVHGVIVDERRRDIFFSLPQRNGDYTDFLSLPALHARLVAGRAWLDGRLRQ